MGQYYMPYVERDGVKETVYSFDYDNGLKLMEHSWLGNNFVDAVISLIDNNPAKVGWVGDYSNDTDCPPDIYEFCWRDDDNRHTVKPEVEEPYFYKDGEYVKHGYFINHSKKEFVSMPEYIMWVKRNSWDMIVNPLPLLTCIGNGQGGGDYWGSEMDMVGYWFMDSIEFTEMDPPEDYTDITLDVLFREGRD